VYQQLLVLEHATAAAAEMPPPDGIRIEPFVGPAWSALAGLAPPGQRHAFQAWAERGGRTCWVAWRGGRAEGYAWLSEEADPDVEHVALPLPADAAFLRGSYVARSARNTGIGTALMRVRLRFAHERGFARAWALVPGSNRASLRMHAKVDPAVRIVGHATQLTLPGRVLTRYRPMAPPQPLGGAG
jgi:GNAT superfamily N-acetyltransferase